MWQKKKKKSGLIALTDDAVEVADAVVESPPAVPDTEALNLI